MFGNGRAAFSTIRLVAEKSVHVTLFTTLGAALWAAFRNSRRQVVLALASGCALGCCSELFQRLFPTRDPAIRDVLINCSSVAAGLTISYCFSQKVGRWKTREVGHLVSEESVGADLVALSLQVGMRPGAPKRPARKQELHEEMVTSTKAS